MGKNIVLYVITLILVSSLSMPNMCWAQENIFLSPALKISDGLFRSKFETLLNIKVNGDDIGHVNKDSEDSEKSITDDSGPNVVLEEKARKLIKEYSKVFEEIYKKDIDLSEISPQELSKGIRTYILPAKARLWDKKIAGQKFIWEYYKIKYELLFPFYKNLLPIYTEEQVKEILGPNADLLETIFEKIKKNDYILKSSIKILEGKMGIPQSLLERLSETEKVITEIKNIKATHELSGGRKQNLETGFISFTMLDRIITEILKAEKCCPQHLDIIEFSRKERLKKGLKGFASYAKILAGNMFEQNLNYSKFDKSLKAGLNLLMAEKILNILAEWFRKNYGDDFGLSLLALEKGLSRYERGPYKRAKRYLQDKKLRLDSFMNSDAPSDLIEQKSLPRSQENLVEQSI